WASWGTSVHGNPGQGFLNQHPRAAHDDRADGSADPIEHSLNPSKLAEMHIQGSQAENHQKGRKDGGGSRKRGAQSTAVQPADVFGKLRGEWSGTELRESQALEVIFLRDPLSLFH